MPESAPSRSSSTPLLLIAWLAVVLPTAWGLQHTIESALKLFSAPAAATATQPAPATTR